MATTPPVPTAAGRRRKIVFLTSSSVFSGGDKHLIELIRRLDLGTVEPAIACFGSDNYSRSLNEQLGLGIAVQTGFRMKNFGRTWRRLRRLRPDTVVVITGVVTAYPWYQYLAARLAGAGRVHAIYHNFTYTPPPPAPGTPWPRRARQRIAGYGTRLRLRARLTAALSDNSICVSEGVQVQLTGYFRFPAARTLTVHNGVDPGYFAQLAPQAVELRRSVAPGPGAVVLVAVCRLVALKGVETVFQAMAELAGELPQLHCLIVGEGPAEPSLRAESARLGLEERVVWAGFQRDVRPYLQAADIFVNPSSAEWVECLPLAVLEAMASGLPCIAARAGGVPELIADGEHGLLFAPGSQPELQTAIARLARDPGARRRLGEQARARVRSQFDIERCMDRIRSLLI